MQLASRFRQQVGKGQPPHTGCLLRLLQETRSRILEQSKGLYYSPARTQRLACAWQAAAKSSPAGDTDSFPHRHWQGHPCPTFSPKAGQLQTSLFLITTRGGARSGKAWGKQLAGGCVRVRGGSPQPQIKSHAGNRRERGLHAARVSGAPGPAAAAPAPPVQSPRSCASLSHPGHRRLLLLADLVEELHVLGHGICWAVHHVMSAAKHCRSPGGVAAEKTL